MTDALPRALRALLGLAADAALPCAPTQAALERAWRECRYSTRMLAALHASRRRRDYEFALTARAAVFAEVDREPGDPLVSEVSRRCCDRIRCVVACPRLGNATTTDERE